MKKMKKVGDSNSGTALAVILSLALATALMPRGGSAQAPLIETLTFAPTADSYVQASTPDSNYDAEPRLRVDAETERITYLRFDVTGVDGRPVEQARLRLHASAPSGDTGGTIHTITDDLWDESTMTFSTRPLVDGPGLDTLGPVTDGQVVEFNLDGAITGDGVYNLAIDSISSDGVSYVSTSAATGEPPQLVLSMTSAPEPVLTIVQPPNDSVFFRGDPVSLQATVTDDVDEGLENSVEWSSDRDGHLGAGGSIAPALSEGTHVVTASVTDTDGFNGADQIGLTVVFPPDENTEPLVTITAPLDGQTFTSSSQVSFTGTAADLEDGSLTDSLSWTSDRDGQLGSGGSFAATLSEGTHDVTASVVDSGDLEGSATVRFDVIPPGALQLMPVADTYVDEQNRTTSYGSSTRLIVDADRERITYLRFYVIGVGARAVERAVVRVRVESSSLAGSDSGGTVHMISDTSWQEHGVTYDTRPAVDGPALDTVGSVAPGDTAEFDVTGAVRGDGVYSFALTSSSMNAVFYESRETGSPRLMLVLRDDAPVVRITQPPDGIVVLEKGLSLTFTGKATDAEDGNLERWIVWRSDLDGLLGAGRRIRVKRLVVGQHRITATVTDSDGLTGQDEIRVHVRGSNAKPQVTITDPSDGAEVPAGAAVTLTATATDDLDGDMSHQVMWRSDRDGNLGTGAIVTATLTEGPHKITASVVDSDGATGKDEIEIDAVASVPAVTILAPLHASVFPFGDSVSFLATATDPDDGDVSAALTWRSSIDGVLGTGANLLTETLSIGVHRITATALDSDGSTGSDQITIEIEEPNERPVVTIREPTDGSVIGDGDPTSFEATAHDFEDGDVSESLRWTSDRDGPLGVGGSFTAQSLSLGSHLITATVTDTRGATASDQVRVTVQTGPSVTILPPLSDSAFLTTTAVRFLAEAEDGGDGDVSGTLTWTSDRDGLIGVGHTFTTDSLTVGNHRVTALATNSRGETAAAEVQFLLSIDRVVVKPAADAYVDQGLPDANLGTDTLLVADAAPSIREAYLRFVVAGIDRLRLDEAKVKLTVSGNGQSDFAGTLHTLSDGTWTEEGVTFNTRPIVDGPEIATIDAGVQAGNVIEFDVTTTLLGDGSYDFALMSPSDDAVKYNSREADSDQPELVVLLGQPQVPEMPDVAIIEPPMGSVFFDDTPVDLTATASDVEDGDLTSAVRWESNLDGLLGTGGSATVFLSRGTHIVSASVRDSFGLSASAAVEVTVVDRPPTVDIIAPADGIFFPAGFSISLTGSAFDDLDGDLSPALVWTSHRDGLIGTGASVTTSTLSRGDHLITANVTNAVGTAAGDAITLFIDQAPPEVTIQVPPTDTTVGADTPITLMGLAADLEDGDLSDRLTWSSDLEGSFGTGATLTTMLRIIGTHWITAAVTDSHGLTGIEGIALTVVPAPPAVTIESPPDNSEVTGPIGFSGTAVDARDGDVSADLRWTSSIDGVLGTGAVIPATLLTPGLHVITADATDSDGLVGSASISMVVGVAVPVVHILEPVASLGPMNEATIELGAPVIFTGTASDASDQDLSANLRWISDLNGMLGTGPSITVPHLVRGRHLITAEATDSSGITGSAQIVVMVTVSSVNNQPLVQIHKPAPGTTVGTGTLVTFGALAEDDLDGDLSAHISWVSSLDGFMGNGSSLTWAMGSTGTHAVTASVANSMGLVGAATVHVTVVPPLARFETDADTHADQSEPDTNYGASPELLLGSDPARRIYLWFTATGLGDAPVESAVVRLHTTSHSSAGSDEGGALHLAAEDTWDELTLTHTNSPTVDPSPLDTVGPVLPSQTVDFDATSVIDGDGTYSFAITPGSDDEVIYRSREAALGRPELIVFFETDAPEEPQVEITEPSGSTTVPIGVPVVFEGTAYDAQDGDLDVAIIWRSDVDWVLGIGPSITRVLSPGPHVIMATVNDVDGNSGADLIHVFVGDGPTVAIDTPVDGAVVPFGEPVLFSGSAFDHDGADLSPFLEWSSDVDGPLGMGPSLTGRLSPGTHTITASVTAYDGTDASESISVAVSVANVGFEDFRYGAGVDQESNRITSAKPESKLWHTDGIWWATLFDPGRAAYTVHRLDMATETWVSTGIVIDERPTSRQDALLDGDTLYVVSRMTDPPGQNRLLRYTYHPSVQTFVLDAGFPVDISGGGTESTTIAKDATGRLWIAYTLGERVLVNHTVGSDTEWATPFIVPIGDEDLDAANVYFDDIAGVVATDGGVGVFWSNQITDKDYFAVYRADGGPADPVSWSLEVAAGGSSVADDHFNMKLASDGRLFVAIKTSRTAPTSTLIGLLVRSPDGTWSELHHVANVESKSTRPLCMLDEVRGTVHVFYSPLEGAIYTKTSDMDTIVFPDPEGLGTPVITNSDANVINNVTSTKQNVGPETGLVVLASGSGKYWHGTIDPEPAPVVTITEPVDGLRVVTGNSVTFSGTAVSPANGPVTENLAWTSSRDGLIGSGSGFIVDSLSEGVHTITASVTDSNLATGTASVTIWVEAEMAPAVTIAQPAWGQKLLVGEPVTLIGTALDSIDGDLGVALQWASDQDGSIGTGTPVTVGALSLGTHTITAQATDSAGLTGSTSVTVDVQDSAPPVVEITSPAGGVTVAFGATVRFAGTGDDAFDGDITASLRWTSDRDGAIGTGGSFSRSSLSMGLHTITATVTDTHGLSNSATVTLSVSDQATAPAVEILAPDDGAIVFRDAPLTFGATAISAIEGDLSYDLAWTSDRDGSIGTGATFTTAVLSAGEHVVSATVADGTGMHGQAQVRVVVDALPVVAIDEPTDGALLLTGRAVVMNATATDEEDGVLNGEVTWTSDRDGTLGRGVPLTVPSLSTGSHTLTAGVTDSHGAVAAASVTVSVEEATRFVVAEADTYVDDSQPDAVLGSETTFRVDASPLRQAFLRFTVTGIDGLTVERALLRLTVGSRSSNASTDGGSVHAMIDGSWSESTTTFNTRPTIDGPVIATHGAVESDQVVEFDVTSAVSGDGVHNFALLTESSDAVGYRSCEATAGHPVLEITLR